MNDYETTFKVSLCKTVAIDLCKKLLYHKWRVMTELNVFVCMHIDKNNELTDIDQFFLS